MFTFINPFVFLSSYFGLEFSSSVPLPEHLQFLFVFHFLLLFLFCAVAINFFPRSFYPRVLVFTFFFLYCYIFLLLV
jgi:hypothetical protein